MIHFVFFFSAGLTALFGLLLLADDKAAEGFVISILALLSSIAAIWIWP